MYVLIVYAQDSYSNITHPVYTGLNWDLGPATHGYSQRLAEPIFFKMVENDKFTFGNMQHGLNAAATHSFTAL